MIFDPKMMKMVLKGRGGGRGIWREWLLATQATRECTPSRVHSWRRGWVRDTHIDAHGRTRHTDAHENPHNNGA